jgi:hypothetical protein
MSSLRGTQKFERVTVTFLPQSGERQALNIPTTFNSTDRMYAWKHAGAVDYMIVPKRVTNTEVTVDIFLNAAKKGKLPGRDVEKVAQNLVKGKIASEWKGLRLGGISKPSIAAPPQKTMLRGTIEEILGMSLDR